MQNKRDQGAPSNSLVQQKKGRLVKAAARKMTVGVMSRRHGTTKDLQSLVVETNATSS